MEKLKQWREGQGISQGELAERLGVKQSYISKYEGGLMRPKLEILFKLQEVSAGAIPVDLWLGWKPAKRE